MTETQETPAGSQEQGGGSQGRCIHCGQPEGVPGGKYGGLHWLRDMHVHDDGHDYPAMPEPSSSPLRDDRGGRDGGGETACRYCAPFYHASCLYCRQETAYFHRLRRSAYRILSRRVWPRRRLSRDGKTPDYERRQPLAWEAARDALASGTAAQLAEPSAEGPARRGKRPKRGVSLVSSPLPRKERE